MAEYVVSSALETFTMLLARHPRMSHGDMGHEIQKLKTELENLLPFLSDADARQSSGPYLEQVLDRIREATYKAVDVVETFSLKLKASKLSGIQRVLDSVSSRATIDEVKEITAEISEMTNSLRRWGLKAGDGDCSYQKQRKVRETFFNFGELGMDSQVHRLSNLLLKRDNHGAIISIVGLGGMGKTTLAKLVYHNKGIRDHFECFAWVVMSQEYVLYDVLESILIQLTSSTAKPESATLLELAAKIRQVLCTKRCLVVLDDVWDGDIFQYLKSKDIYIAANSGIIVTTRNPNIASFAGSDDIHYAERLTEESSWELFHRIAFYKRDETDIKDEMINLGKKIIGYCEGLPLLISLLAGLLSTKQMLEEWQAVSEKMSNREQTELNPFELCYDDLPYYLKPCFLYFSQFSEDFEIPVKRLMHMWIADGVVSTMAHERDGQIENMEDVAYGYLTELAERYMVLIGERGSTGKIKICKMHDMMLELAKWEAMHENFSNCSEHEARSKLFKASRVSIRTLKHNDMIQEEIRQWVNPRIRSLIYDLPISRRNQLSMKLVDKSLKFLRVLSVENYTCDGGMLMKEIGDLVLLRYLSLKNSDIRELPPSIFLLRFLQSLDLRTSASSLKIPNMKWRTENLRHLYMHPAYSLEKGGKLKLGHLSNLQTLVNIDNMDLDHEDVVQLDRLKKLVIIIRNMQRGFVVCREFGAVFKFKNNTLGRLQSLGILNMTSTNAEIRPFLSRCYAINKMQLHGHITKLSECHQLSFKLAKLIIKGTFLEEDPMATLEKLPNLRVLYLSLESFIGCKLSCSENGFPQLESLGLHGLHNLEELWAENGAMPHLSRSDIVDCPKLNAIPDKVKNLTAFRNQR